MKFIDLFCGLGGFHVALKKLGHKCVYASEILPNLRKNYERNFKIKVNGDITRINIRKIPNHQILCAGFPCQPFSKAGSQEGFSHKIAGNMFSYILKILRIKKPKYIILENVPNLFKHNDGKTWKKMEKQLINIGYKIHKKIISPTDFGIPQDRNRFYIVGTKSKNRKFTWPINTKKNFSFKNFIVKKPKIIRHVTKERYETLKVWNKIITNKPKNIRLINPLWTTEFKATYPYKNQTPFSMTAEMLGKLKGKYGVSLRSKSKKMQMKLLPNYAQTKEKRFPLWKIKILNKNRLFYKKNKKWCDKIEKKLKSLIFEANQKFEWNCMGDKYDFNNKLISFRPSGIRVRRNISSPTLVASTISQLPIIYNKKRYLSFEECLKLQGFPKNFKHTNTFDQFYSSIGNAVNCKVVEKIAKNLIN